MQALITRDHDTQRSQTCATHKATGEVVRLKQVRKVFRPFEREIAEYFSGEFASEPRNHHTPVYEFLESPHDPDLIIFVMPFLCAFDDAPFLTVGEAVDFLEQIFDVS